MPVRFLFFCLIMFLLGFTVFVIDKAEAGSVYGAQKSGLEPPDTPKRPLGNFGHLDAYGNVLTDTDSEQKIVHKRLQHGAYTGRKTATVRDTELPNPDKERQQRPVWSFH